MDKLNVLFEQIKLEEENREYFKDAKLTNNWEMDFHSTQAEDFSEKLSQKLTNENLLAGYKKIEAKKDDIKLAYHTLVFLDMKGNIVSDLYYDKDYNFLSVDLSKESYDTAEENLTFDLNQEVEKLAADEIAKEERKRISHI